MTAVEIVVTGGITASILSFFLILFILVLYGQTSSYLSKLSKKKLRNPQKRKRLALQRKRLALKKRKYKKMMYILLISTLFTGLMSRVGEYYRSTQLSVEDSRLIIKSHYLLNDFEAQIAKAENQSENPENLMANIRYLSNMLAVYGTKRASFLNTLEGQQALNKYYKSMEELGINISQDPSGISKDSKQIEEFKKDLQRVKSNQKMVFSLYKIENSDLKKQIKN